MATVSSAPPVARVLGFDPDDGIFSFVDDKGQPRRLDLRAAEARTASKEKLAALTSENGSELYGITAKGDILRLTPTGDWSFEPPSPARWTFPQENGSLVIAGNQAGKTELWLIRPTDEEILETASLPQVSGSIRAQVGDRIYFAVDSGLIGVRARDLTPVKSVRMKEPVLAIVPTPSGDRLYVAMKESARLAVVDRYTESLTEEVALPGPVAELRMDPLGKSLLAKPAGRDNVAWVISVGSNKVTGTIETDWRADLPAFGPQNTIVATRGSDAVFLDPASLAAKNSVRGGASDFWYFVPWNGFRPRAADLDRPVTFDTPATAQPADSVTPKDSMRPPPVRDASPTMIEPPIHAAPASVGYLVSFAAVLSEQRANETAAGIVVNGLRPHVVAGQSGSTTVYRVVLGPYPTREQAESVGRDSKRQYWVYEESK